MTSADTDVLDAADKQLIVDNIIRKYSWCSFGMGAVPLPLIDILGITGFQLKMLNDLAKFYQTPFAENRAKSLIAALVGGIAPTGLAWSSIGSLIKAIPAFGTIAGVLTLPTFAGASTFAIGRVFARHFESGGTLLNFDPKADGEYFRGQYEKGKESFTKEASKDAGKKPEGVKPAVP
ncbi:MAG: DUF697 domain-containing protein [Gammaproteobacteria bacterium]|nr:DUF697 domain-containing protein [Gammaproteobacteria bacterium]